MECYTGLYLLRIKVIRPKEIFVVFKLFIKRFIKVAEIGSWVVALTERYQTAK